MQLLLTQHSGNRNWNFNLEMKQKQIQPKNTTSFSRESKARSLSSTTLAGKKAIILYKHRLSAFQCLTMTWHVMYVQVLGHKQKILYSGNGYQVCLAFTHYLLTFHLILPLLRSPANCCQYFCKEIKKMFITGHYTLSTIPKNLIFLSKITSQY